MGQRVGPVQAAVMLLSGILIGQRFCLPFPVCIIVMIICLGGSYIFYLRGRQYELDQPPKKISRALLCLALFAAGMGRTAMMAGDRRTDAVENFTDRDSVTIIGHVIAPPVETASRTTLRIAVDENEDMEDQPGSGKLILVFFRKPDKFHYGDRLYISGKVLLPPDSSGVFSYRSYLERDGITAMINNPRVEKQPGFTGSRILARIFRLREVLTERVYRLFPKPENALMAGILIGDESKITSDVERDFQKTGTAHIIAISGANFMVLTHLLAGILRRLIRQWWSSVVMLPLIVFYVILVGGNPAVVRAAIMSGLCIIGSIFGRDRNGINNLAFASAVMGMVRPAVLSDLGFQLSVTATLGILLFSEPIGNQVRRLVARIFPKISEGALTFAVTVLNDLCILSVSAQIFTVWISAQAFGKISLISLPANFLIAFFQSYIMIGGFTALVLSFLFYPLGAAAAWLVYPAPALTIRLVRLCAGAGWGSAYFDLSPLQAWLIIALILGIWLGREILVDSLRRRRYLPWAVPLLGFAAVMIWVNAADRLDRRVKIRLDQTKTSMTLMIRSPAGRWFVMGDGLTDFAAQEILEKQILPVRIAPAAAWIDIQETWMQKAFIESGAGDDLSVLYLNGVARNGSAGIPERLESGYKMSADGVTIRLASSYLGKRAWIIEADSLRLLIPNGIPPKRIFTRDNPKPKELSLTVLGKRDDLSDWDTLCGASGTCPYLPDRTEKGTVSLSIGSGRISFSE